MASQEQNTSTTKPETPSIQDSSTDTENQQAPHEKLTFPEGGTRGWLVVLGAAAAAFAAFGYVTAFGWVHVVD